MKNFLSKSLAKKENFSYQIIDFDKLLYIYLYDDFDIEDEALEEFLFEQGVLRLGIKDEFDYHLSYSQKHNLFFLKDEFLDKDKKLAIAEPLVFKSLAKCKFCVIILRKTYSFICFFDDEKLLLCKNIPKFNLDFLKDKTQAQKQELFEALFDTQAKIKDDINFQESQQIFVDDGGIGFLDFLKGQGDLDCEAVVSSDLNLKSGFFLKLEKGENFLRDFIPKKNIFLGISLAFIASVLCVFVYLGVSAFLKYYDYQENYAFLSENEKKGQDLNELFSKLQATSQENEEQIASLEKKLEDLHFEPMSHFFSALEPMTSLLRSYEIKLETFEFEGKKYKLVLIDNDKTQELIKSLYMNSHFILKSKELKEGFYTLVLELKND